MNQVAGNPAGALRFPVRDEVQKLGLLTLVRNVRALLRREVSGWIKSGCPSPAPNVVKMSVVRHYVQSSSVKYFIETGTFMGSMVEYISQTGVKCITIEIDDAIYQRAKYMLKSHDNVTCLKGDSSVVLPKLLNSLDSPAVFWLDGHYSGGFTGKSNIDTPVSQELDMVLGHKVKEHVVLIDDARDFTGMDGYPRLSALLSHFDDHPHYRAEVSADIIRILPRR